MTDAKGQVEPPPVATSLMWIEERLEAVEGHINDINLTIGNHMTEYKAEFRVVGVQIRALTWVIGIVSSIMVLTVGALLAIVTLQGGG